MYYEERIENGALYYRHEPDGAWVPWSVTPPAWSEVRADAPFTLRPRYRVIHGPLTATIDSRRLGPIEWTRRDQADFAARMMGA